MAEMLDLDAPLARDEGPPTCRTCARAGEPALCLGNMNERAIGLSAIDKLYTKCDKRPVICIAKGIRGKGVAGHAQ